MRPGVRAGSVHTLIATARLNGLNPEAYLEEVLAKVAERDTINRIDELLPSRLAKAKRESLREPA